MPQQPKLIKYILTGGSTFVVEYGSFLFLVYLFKESVTIAHIGSYLLALVVNFLLLRLWTFSDSQNSKVVNQVAKYGVLVAFNLPATTYLIHLFNEAGLAPFVAKLLVVLLAAAWNYVVYNEIIFSKAK